MGIVSQISAILRDKSKIVAAANAADLAYNVGAGTPEAHKPFAETQAEAVAVNAAGLYALVESVGLVAALNGQPNDDGYKNALMFFVQLGDQMPEDQNGRTLVDMSMRLAHATWMTSQPFRGIATDPLGRVSRSVVMVYDELPPKEQIKDITQIRAAAKWLAQELGL